MGKSQDKSAEKTTTSTHAEEWQRGQEERERQSQERQDKREAEQDKSDK